MEQEWEAMDNALRSDLCLHSASSAGDVVDATEVHPQPEGAYAAAHFIRFVLQDLGEGSFFLICGFMAFAVYA